MTARGPFFPPTPDDDRAARATREHDPDAMFADGTGIGWGVHDRLNQLGWPNVVGVDFSSKADRTDSGAVYSAASDAAARYAFRPIVLPWRATGVGLARSRQTAPTIHA
jgi:hypothetical protein